MWIGRLSTFSFLQRGYPMSFTNISPPLRSCITRANFRLAKLEKPQFTKMQMRILRASVTTK